MSGTINRAMTAKEWGLLLALSAVWSCSFYFNAIALRDLPTFTVVVGRVVFAALILHAAVALRGERLGALLPLWREFLVMGVINNVVPFSLIVWGQTHAASGVAAILNATTPLFAVVVAHVLTADEKMTGGRVAGVLAGLAGVAAMIGPGALARTGIDSVAEFAFLGASLSYAFAGVFGRRFQQIGVTPLLAATGTLTASSLILLPLMLLVGQPWALPVPGASALAALLGLASFSTALAYIFYFRLLATAGATNVLLVTFLVPVGAVLLGIWLLDETLRAQHGLGLALIGLGLAAIDGRPWRLLRRQAAPSA